MFACCATSTAATAGASSLVLRIGQLLLCKLEPMFQVALAHMLEL